MNESPPSYDPTLWPDYPPPPEPTPRRIAGLEHLRVLREGPDPAEIWKLHPPISTDWESAPRSIPVPVPPPSSRARPLPADFTPPPPPPPPIPPTPPVKTKAIPIPPQIPPTTQPPPAPPAPPSSPPAKLTPTQQEKLDREKVVGVGGWLGTLIVLILPGLNLLALLIWAFGAQSNRNKQNFARAILWLLLLIGGLYILGQILSGI